MILHRFQGSDNLWRAGGERGPSLCGKVVPYTELTRTPDNVTCPACARAVPVAIDVGPRDLRLFSEDQVKRAFWATFHEAGELFFDYLTTPAKSAASTESHWAEFVEKLRGQPIVALQVVDYRSLLVKYMRHVWRSVRHLYKDRETFTAHRPPREVFTDAEWAELQRLAEEASR